jgi:hypothetical protein
VGVHHPHRPLNQPHRLYRDFMRFITYTKQNVDRALFLPAHDKVNPVGNVGIKFDEHSFGAKILYTTGPGSLVFPGQCGLKIDRFALTGTSLHRDSFFLLIIDRN